MDDLKADYDEYIRVLVSEIFYIIQNLQNESINLDRQKVAIELSSTINEFLDIIASVLILSNTTYTKSVETYKQIIKQLDEENAFLNAMVEKIKVYEC